MQALIKSDGTKAQSPFEAASGWQELFAHKLCGTVESSTTLIESGDSAQLT